MYSIKTMGINITFELSRYNYLFNSWDNFLFFFRIPFHLCVGHKCDICPSGQVETRGKCQPRETDPVIKEILMADREFSESDCSKDTDCSGQSSVCLNGECRCAPGFISSSRHVCKEDPSPKSPCEGDPCHGSTCEEHDGTFTCYCGQGRVGHGNYGNFS